MKTLESAKPIPTSSDAANRTKPRDPGRNLESALVRDPTVSSADHDFASLRGILAAGSKIRMRGRVSRWPRRSGDPVVPVVPVVEDPRLVLSAARGGCMRPVVRRLTVLARVRMIWVYRCLALPG